ncbi:EFR1 family ferrodoxin [Anaerosporobacter sp.]|uniref:EFR1 family ferrodoxin n=1 Tax=Anaerosporobacter sp. TaxID=1872529 RepID=UPI00286F6211|nr:EFR1 family ferrodoxin [Anaerosporobacter sp.]
MIFYFSATGNSKHVVSKIKHDNEMVIAIDEAVKSKQFSYKVTDGRVGIVSPTYDFTIPSIVSDFLNTLTIEFEEKPYTFYIGTYGTTTGAAALFANQIMKEKGLSFDATFDIKMPDTWTPMFDLSDASKVKGINEKADREIDVLIRQLNQKVKGKHMGLTVPFLIGKIGKRMYDNNTRNTSNLSITDECVGCGLCAKKCPVQAVEMKGKKPVWVKDKCVMCLGCLHRCPKFAIEYGTKTKKHGQYIHP